MNFIARCFGFLSVAIVLATTAAVAQSQLRMTLTISPKPSPYLSDWSSKKETAILTVINSGQNTVMAKIDAQVTLNGALKAQTKYASMPVIALPAGVSTFFADQIIPAGAVTFKDGTDQAAIKTGMLPAGNYQLCVSLLSPNSPTDKLVELSACKTFLLTSYQPPTLLLPTDKSFVNSNIPPTFHWTPVTPTPTGKVRYQVVVFQVMNGQTPAQAFKSNHPILDRDATLPTQMLWPADVPFPATATQFVWSVRAYDAQNKPIGEPDGYATPFSFTAAKGGHANDTTNNGPITHQGGGGQDTVRGHGWPSGHQGNTSSGNGPIVVNFQDPYEGQPKKDLPFSGMVRNSTNNFSVSGVTVEFRYAKQTIFGMQPYGATLTATTDANGKFKFPAVKAPTFFKLTIKKNGFKTVTQIGTPYKIESAITDYLVVIQPRVMAIIGLAEDALTKKNIRNAVVELWRRPTPWCSACPIGQQGGPQYSIPTLVASTKTMDFGNSDTAAQQGGMINVMPLRLWGNSLYVLNNGTFVLENIPWWDNYFIKIKHPRYQTEEVYHVAPTANDTINVGIVKVKAKRGTIKVTVLDKIPNKGLVGATVRVFPDVATNPPANLVDPNAHVNSDGSYNASAGNLPMQGQYAAYAQTVLNGGAYIPSGGLVNPQGMQSGGGSGAVGANGWIDASAGWGIPMQTGGGANVPQMAPEKMPDIPPIATGITDASGKVTLTNILVNDPNQATDRYSVWVRTAGYVDAWKPVRLVLNNQTKEVLIKQDSAKGFIHGIVRDKLANKPVGNAKVELVKKVNNKDTTVMTINTNPDGTYTLYPVKLGTYGKIKFSATGYTAQEKPGPIVISNGTDLTASAELPRDKGKIFVTVLAISGSDTIKAQNAFIHSDSVPSISAVTSINGNVLIEDVPTGVVNLVISYPMFADKSVLVTVPKDNQKSVTVYLAKPNGEIKVTVKDSVTGNFLANASVTIGSKTEKTNVAGLATFSGLQLGQQNVLVIADTTGGFDYKNFSSTKVINEGLNQPLTIKMTQGARIYGKVTKKVGGGPIDSASVTIAGVPGVSAKTNAAGEYILRNVPTGVKLNVQVAKPKFILGKTEVQALQKGQQKKNVDLQLADSPIDSVYGFAIIVDTVTDAPAGNKYLKGKFKVPNNLMFKAGSKSSSFEFLFENLEVDGTTMKPVALAYYFPYSEMPVSLFEALDAKLTGGEDFLKVEYDTVLKTGAIRGKELKLLPFIPKILPGSQWIPEKLSDGATAAGAYSKSLGFWADGAFHGGNVFKVTSNEVEVNMWGFKVAVDYTKTTFDTTGFKYVGSLTIPKINKTIKINLLEFKNKGTAAKMDIQFEQVKLDMSTPFEIDLKAFKFADTSFAWNQQGIIAGGYVVLTKLGNRKFRFENMFINKEGKFMGVQVKMDPGTPPINVLGAQFTLSGLGFGTNPSDTTGTGANQQITPENHYFTFSGKLLIPQLSKPIEFQNLIYNDTGSFYGTIAFNQSVKLMNVVTFELQSIEFGFDAAKQKKFIFVKGGVAFSIPLLSIQAGNVRIFEDKTFAIEKIGFGFNAGPVKVSLSAQWSDTAFGGSGMLEVAPILAVSGEFYYKDGNNWKIKIAANIPPIPIGPVAITGVSGMLARNNGYWAFGFGGSVATAAGKESMELTVQVQVETTPNGPIIQGDAWLKTLGVQIGEAHIVIDIPQKRFAGSVQFGLNKSGVKVTAFIDFEVKAGVYWFVGGGATFTFPMIATLQVQAFVGKNYQGFKHTLPVTFHPDNQTLNGFHMDASMVYPKVGKSGDVFQLEFGYYLFGAIDWNGNLAGGIKIAGNAALDLWVVGFTASIDLQAAIEYKNSLLKFHGHAKFNAKAWIWPCDANSSCDEWCKFCPCITAVVDYAGNKGWEFDFSLGCQ
ncbi:MAG: carboxypeptidase regulatory-like domain-containing protein [Chlorobi bacterium]|nr:carboxypeptidase regulatory-like domain-containing protein [Chlorobiota bacterium]